SDLVTPWDSTELQMVSKPRTEVLIWFANIPPPELAGNTVVAQHGTGVVRKLGELLKAKGDHASVLTPLVTAHPNM
uniref:Uncharacterized protein n=1 Tax=Scleropages formosus TaxID=113540 RepID=A0A8C9SGY6_SCLFO